MARDFVINVEIDEDGNITSEVDGIKGPSCEGLMDFLKSIGNVVDDKKTDDYYRREGRVEQVVARH